MDKSKKLTGSAFIDQVSSDIKMLINTYDRKKPTVKSLINKKAPKNR